MISSSVDQRLVVWEMLSGEQVRSITKLKLSFYDHQLSKARLKFGDHGVQV